MVFTKLITSLVLGVALTNHAPAQDPAGGNCEDQSIDLQQKQAKLLEENARAFELSVAFLRDVCKSAECTYLAHSMDLVGKQDRKTAKLIRAITEAQIEAR